MKFLLIKEDELDDLARPYQAFFNDTVESDIYYRVHKRGEVDLPIEDKPEE